MDNPTEILNLLEPTYTPNQAVSESLHCKYLIAFIGAFAVGKTTLIQEIDRRHEAYSEVISFTTRPPRGHDDRYRFIDHTDTNLIDLSAKAARGELVNFSIHPTTGHIYGTEAGDYRTDRCMLAVTAKSFETDKNLAFAKVVPIVVIADESAWLARIRERSTSGQEFSARLAEARLSLTWSLERDDVYFADNTTTNIGLTADHIVTHIETGGKRNAMSRNIASRMLQAASA